MSETTIVIGLIFGIGGLGWLVFQVVTTLSAGGESSARADINAAGGLPGSEQIDNLAAGERPDKMTHTQ